MARQPDGDPWPEDGSLLPGTASTPFCAYVHVPFCSVRCGYCDFNTYTTGFGRGADLDTYADSVVREIDLSREVLRRRDLEDDDRLLRSVFFGGGTPSLLSPEAIETIMDRLENTFGFAPDLEVTLEANPETLDPPRARAFTGSGVNRFSIGMQSAVPRVLEALDRKHDPASVLRAAAAARDAGAQVSVDLIYGAPGETLEQWENSVSAAVALAPDHISAYSLIIEEGTKMGRDLKAGRIPAPNPDVDAAKYEAADRLLTEAGYQWYEISNFSRSIQARSTHNLAYWRNWDWWGYGPGAHSHVATQRWWNVKHPHAYAGRLAAGRSPGVAGETLTEEDRRVEAIMLGIRTVDGVDLARLQDGQGDRIAAVQRLSRQGLLTVEADSRIVLTLKGRLLADYVTRVLLGWE